MMTAKKFNVLLCLVVFSFTALSEEQVFLSDHVAGVQTVTVQSQGNTDDDLELCLVKPAKKIPNRYVHNPYAFQHANHLNSNHLRQSARAPPFV